MNGTQEGWSRGKFSPWAGLPIAVGSAWVVLLLQGAGLLQLLEWAVLDGRFRLEPPRRSEPPIVLVTIDDPDIRELGQWPLNDATLARLLTRIRQQQPRVVGLNLYRDLPVGPGQAELNAVAQTMPNLVGIYREMLPGLPPDRQTRFNRYAASDLVVDGDGKIRRGLLSLYSDRQDVVFTLGTRLALDSLAQDGIHPIPLGQSNPNRPRTVQLGRSQIQPIQAQDGGYVGVDVGGFQMLLRHSAPGSIRRISARSLLQGQVDPKLLRDRIVIVGSIAESVNDRFYTPLTTSTETRVSSLDIEADITLNLLDAAHGVAPLRGVAEPWRGLWILTWAWMGTAIGIRLRTWSTSLIQAGLALGLLILLSQGFFGLGWWIALVAPGLALSIAAALSRSYVAWASLRSSHQTLAAYSKTLELRVEARTEELVEKNRDLELARSAAESASQAKSEFLARMSHEFRTPLNAILGFSQLLGETIGSDPSAREQVSIINRSGEHLLGLINDVLEMSKIEAGLIVLHETGLDLKSLFESVLGLFRLQAEARGLQLLLRIDPAVPPRVLADETKLRQVLVNLLSNAIKCTQVGRIELSLGLAPDWLLPKDSAQNLGQALGQALGQDLAQDSAQNSAQEFGQDGSAAADRCWLHIAVTDTGIGIAAADCERIFSPFIQASHQGKPGPGTGLGLSISQRFVSLMGGQIRVESQVGVGSTFYFVIGLRPQLKPITPINRSVLRLTPQQRTWRILVVDDAPVNRKLLVMMLQSLGFTVAEAENGRDAIDRWRNWQPDLVLMDMQMPLIDGYEATRQIRRLVASNNPDSPIAQAAPVIIAVTASAFEEERQATLKAGCDDFISKPFKKEDICAIVAQHLDVQFDYAEPV
jgi:adenylate cyclase